jgi:hypothetical protein
MVTPTPAKDLQRPARQAGPDVTFGCVGDRKLRYTLFYFSRTLPVEYTVTVIPRRDAHDHERVVLPAMIRLRRMHKIVRCNCSIAPGAATAPRLQSAAEPSEEAVSVVSAVARGSGQRCPRRRYRRAGALGRGAAGPVLLHVGTAFVEPTDGHTYDPTDGATTDPYPAVPACPWVATDDPAAMACAMAAVLKRAKALASPIVVSFMVVAFLVV